ncbi:MAG: valine--tRNA ligase [Actinomycetota bacterium]|nr:valine--tRNA ligase [Actinomycetota bacterium]
MTAELPKAYQPHEIERRWYEEWEKQELFRADAESAKDPYTIVLPPPNVTGALHIGHALGHTLMDALTRRARMQGKEALWLPGTDHAGIATQNVVERELKKEGSDRHELGRDAFVERVWEWKHEYGGRILDQMRQLGDACDWTRERFTMDEGLSRAVRTVFVRWFDDGLIYRGNRIINWCPRCETALSDIEVEHEDVAGELVTFRYELADGSGSIAVATTRTETMLGDTGIFVHPDDERYSAFVGKRVRHPFFPERELPIVADEGVDPEFGTGAVKGTPAHDPLDFEMGERKGLEKINIFDGTAHVNDNGGRFAGLDRYEARRDVLEELDALGLVDAVERPYVHSVGHCYRCHTEVEPWLSLQWFVRMEPLAKPAMEVVEQGRIRFEPKRFGKSYMDWVASIRDWCISRQIWWGHRIPIWYCDECDAVFASLEDPDACVACASRDIHQDPDVLDTWFSSQLWPFSTLGWPDETPDLSFFYPTSVMVTGYEILYLWVARMVMSGLYFMNDVPFRDVFIHGIVRDGAGKKMSKSLGNVIDPLDMISRYGADALRFSLAFASIPGNDMKVSEERIQDSRNFANKLWNASRFVLTSLGDERPELGDADSLATEDRWILSRLDHTLTKVEAQLHEYNFGEAMRDLYRFVWSEFCDWYIELSKLRPDAAAPVLVHVLDRILRVLHPVMPFITEELWQRLRPGTGSIMLAEWPAPAGVHDLVVEGQVERVQDVVTTIRRLKIEHGIPQGKRVSVTIAAGEFAGELDAMSAAIMALARLEDLALVGQPPSAGGTARAVTMSGIEIFVALGDAVDLELERKRLRDRLVEVEAEIRRADGKLRNESFVAKAPEAVVAKERAKLEEHQQNRLKLRSQLETLGG